MATCDKPIKVTLKVDDYTVYCCADGHVHIHVETPELTGHLVLETSNDAYTFGEAIMRGFDHLEGITAPKRT